MGPVGAHFIQNLLRLFEKNNLAGTWNWHLEVSICNPRCIPWHYRDSCNETPYPAISTLRVRLPYKFCDPSLKLKWRKASYKFRVFPFNSPRCSIREDQSASAPIQTELCFVIFSNDLHPGTWWLKMIDVSSCVISVSPVFKTFRPKGESFLSTSLNKCSFSLLRGTRSPRPRE